VVGFTIATTAILLSPLGLWGAVGLHIACNTWFQIHLIDECLRFIRYAKLAERLKLREHLATCPVCSARETSYHNTRRAVSSAASSSGV
jgi:hypothetical protein